MAMAPASVRTEKAGKRSGASAMASVAGLAMILSGCGAGSFMPGTAVTVTAPPQVTVTAGQPQQAQQAQQAPDQPTVTVTKERTLEPPAAKAPGAAANAEEGNWKDCGNGVHVEPQTTTCPFAQDVASMARGGSGYGTVYSATTRQSYATSCSTAASDVPWIYSCDTGRGGHVTVHVY